MSVEALRLQRGSERPVCEDWDARKERVTRLVAVLVALSFALAWTLLQGKTFHYDAINYHFYLGFAALHDRFATDFFAAGTSSYINPYAFVPLHLLAASGAGDVVSAITIAAVHSTILWLTYELALVLVPASGGRARNAFALFALVLAGSNPVFLQGLGLTLVDIPLGVLVVAGWALLGASVKDGALWKVVAGAALCGAAAALKLSNALFAAAALAIVVFLPGGWRLRLRAVIAYCAVCGVAFLAVSAPWSWKLWETFGNPVFPFLNDVFRSPDFTSAPIHYERFRPADWIEYIGRPFAMATPVGNLHVEGYAPDIRMAALLVASVLWVVVCRFPAGRPAASPGERVDRDDRAPPVVLAVGVAFLLAWCLWLKASGNSRYFIPMSSVAAALLAALLHRFHRRWASGSLVAAALIFLAQALPIGLAADWKREGLPWDGPLLRYDFPSRFRTEPYLFLSTRFLSGSAFLPHWHPQSGMMTTTGFYSLGPGRPGWDRARALIDRNADRLRILTLMPPGVDKTTGLPGPAASDLDVHVARFGLAVDPTDCEFVSVQANLAGHVSDPRQRWTNWVTCRLKSAPEAGERYAREVAQIDAVFDRIEATCPNLFQPPRPVTEQTPHWRRLYNMGSEIQLWIEDGRILYLAPTLGGDAIDIGTVADWMEHPQPIDCSRKSAPAFGGLLERGPK